MRLAIRPLRRAKALRSVSAPLTALALLASYIEEVKIGLLHIGETSITLSNGTVKAITDANILDFVDYYHISMMNPNVLIGVFIGSMMAFLFCGLTMNAVGRAAQSMVEEVRRQFREIKGFSKARRPPIMRGVSRFRPKARSERCCCRRSCR